MPKIANKKIPHKANKPANVKKAPNPKPGEKLGHAANVANVGNAKNVKNTTQPTTKPKNKSDDPTVIYIIIGVMVFVILIVVLFVGLAVKRIGGDGSSNKDQDTDADSYDDVKRDMNDPNGRVIDEQTFDDECLKKHNHYRSLHQDTSPLTLSAQLTKSARNISRRMAKSGVWEHSHQLLDAKNMGENLYMIWTSGDIEKLFKTFGGKKPVKSWYDEIKLYNFESPDMDNLEPVGHFTQMVWRGTQQVGCAKAFNADTNKLYVVCHYTPPGNVIGDFVNNVKPLN